MNDLLITLAQALSVLAAVGGALGLIYALILQNRPVSEEKGGEILGHYESRAQKELRPDELRNLKAILDSVQEGELVADSKTATMAAVMFSELLTNRRSGVGAALPTMVINYYNSDVDTQVNAIQAVLGAYDEYESKILVGALTA